jgi:hypothetical protein
MERAVTPRIHVIRGGILLLGVNDASIVQPASARTPPTNLVSAR